jgi:hypothetical protein
MHRYLLVFFCLCSTTLSSARGQQVSAPSPRPANIYGTVTDTDGAAIPGATVVLRGQQSAASRTVTSNEMGGFELDGVAPTVSYTLTVTAKGFASWTSAEITLAPGQALDLEEIKLGISVVETTVAAQTEEQIATEQVHAAEQQRVFGVIPNFYVVYDKHPVPLTARLKYQLAFRAATDIVSIAGDFALSGMNQAADTPGYQQGLKGYGQRFGASYADSFSNIMIGGGLLPALLHQDPRYYYLGEGTGKRRALHALASPFVCKGDNGHQQFNISSIGGDLISSSMTNLYYPDHDRGPGLVVQGTLINTGGRLVNALVQEFLLKKHTSNADH